MAKKTIKKSAKKTTKKTVKKTTKKVALKAKSTPQKTTKKTAGKSATTTRKQVIKTKSITIKAEKIISSNDRYEMIRQAAYYRALNRGFSLGNEDYDYFEAEKEVNEYIEKNNYSIK